MDNTTHKTIEITLKQQFYQFIQDEPTEHAYILFNSANHPQLPQQYYALDTEQQYIGLLQELLEGYNEQSIPVMPYLVEINQATVTNNAFIDWLFSDNITINSFFVMSSDASLNEIAAHWDSIALVYNSQQQTVIMRLFDGRIGKKFLPQLNASEQQQLLGPCQHLWFPDNSGTPTIINNIVDYTPNRDAPWFHLTPQHEQWLSGDAAQLQEYNLTLHLWEHHEQILSSYPQELIAHCIHWALKKAQALDLKKETSIKQFVALCFYYSPVFYRHPTIQSLWATHDNEAERLAQLNKISPQQWQEISQHNSLNDWKDMPDKPIAQGESSPALI